jgi:negative regulator of replication initiation
VAENTETTTDDTSKTVLTGVDSSTINGEQVEEFEEKVESSEEEPKAIEVSEQIKEENKEEQTEETKEENKEEASTSGEYKEEKEEINKFLKEKILPAFAKMKTYGREGVTDLLLAYYIEGVVELMFGVANVPYYFDQCL